MKIINGFIEDRAELPPFGAEWRERGDICKEGIGI